MKNIIILFAILCSVSCIAQTKQILFEKIDKIPYFDKSEVQSKCGTCAITLSKTFGKVDEMVTATGIFAYTIWNDTNETQNYWVDEYMCIADICTHIRNTVTLNSGDSEEGGGPIPATYVFEKPGIYTDEAILKVEGYKHDCVVDFQNKVIIK